MKPVGFFQFLFSSCQLGVGCLVSLSLIRSLPPHFAGHCDAVAAAAAASLLMMESRCVCVCVCDSSSSSSSSSSFPFSHHHTDES